MVERLFLFPELAQSDPTSVLQTAVLANSKPFQIDGYKLFAPIDRLDDMRLLQGFRILTFSDRASSIRPNRSTID
jgi:hypothetical protein